MAIEAYSAPEAQPFSWDSETFGQAGHNVHESSSGSWMESDQ